MKNVIILKFENKLNEIVKLYKSMCSVKFKYTFLAIQEGELHNSS